MICPVVHHSRAQKIGTMASLCLQPKQRRRTENEDREDSFHPAFHHSLGLREESRRFSSEGCKHLFGQLCSDLRMHRKWPVNSGVIHIRKCWDLAFDKIEGVIGGSRSTACDQQEGCWGCKMAADPLTPFPTRSGI